MKRIFLTSFILLVAFSSCQDTFEELNLSDKDYAITRSMESEYTDYYWFYDQKLPLKIIENQSYVIYKEYDEDALSLSLSKHNAQVIDDTHDYYLDLEYAKEITKPYDSSKWTAINLSVERAYEIPEVMYAAPYYQGESGNVFPLTNKLYVFLKSEEDLPKLKELAIDYNVKIAGEIPDLPLTYLLICTPDSKGNALEIANRLYETGMFEATEPVFVSLRFATNDTNYSSQWNLHGTYGSYTGYGIKYVQAANGSLIPTSGNVVIAVVDSGVQLNHPDISYNSYSWNAYTQSGSSFVYASHGTMVAGVSSAISNNGIGIAGVGSSVSQVMSLSIGTTPDPDAAARAIKKAADQGASVINCSWGVQNSVAVTQAIYYAVTYGRDGKGCVVVVASGNESNDYLSFPANYNPEKSVIAVGASSYNGYRADFSNFGTNLDIVAPGVNIPTTNTGSGYTTNSGTSLAAPHVSGVAALMLAWNPNLSYDEVGFILQSTANKSLPSYAFSSTTKVGGTWNSEVGHGLINMYAALNMAKNTAYNSYGDVSMTGGQTNLNSGGSGYVGTSFTIPYTSGYRYYWCGSYTGTCDRWYVTPNGNNSSVGNVSVYLNPGQSGVLTVTCRMYSNTAYIGKATQYVYVSY